MTTTMIMTTTTTVTRSERAKGRSGEALRGLLVTLRALSGAERPPLLVLECVARLGHRRRVDPDGRTGAQYIKDEIAKCGYFGDWHTVCPSQFYLPQHRPRTYGLFWLDAGPATVVRGRELLARCMLPVHEPLAVLLTRAGRPCGSHTSAELDPDPDLRRTKWKSRHAAYRHKHGLTQEALKGQAEFNAAVGTGWSERQREAWWLRLAVAERDDGLKWKEAGLVVTPVGRSVDRMTIWQERFPAVLPMMKYGILSRGRAELATAEHFLALQGIQAAEINAFRLRGVRTPLLRNLAGNAFTANILAACFVAGLLA